MTWSPGNELFVQWMNRAQNESMCMKYDSTTGKETLVSKKLFISQFHRFKMDFKRMLFLFCSEVETIISMNLIFSWISYFLESNCFTITSVWLDRKFEIPDFLGLMGVRVIMIQLYIYNSFSFFLASRKQYTWWLDWWWCKYITIHSGVQI